MVIEEVERVARGFEEEPTSRQRRIDPPRDFAPSKLLGRREARKEKRATELDPGEASLELDLRGLTGDEAEATTVSALDAAVLAEQPYLRIIHGMGTGVVRERVRQVLQRDKRVKKFDYAPRPQGGVGVTIAEFA